MDQIERDQIASSIYPNAKTVEDLPKSSVFKPIPKDVEEGEIEQPRIYIERRINIPYSYFHLMNVNLINVLLLWQALASLVISICLVILIAKGYLYDIKWAVFSLVPTTMFFGVVVALSWYATIKQTRCSIGAAMAFQIFSAVDYLLLALYGVLYLTLYVSYLAWDEIIFPSVMIISAAAIFVLSILINIQFCRGGCCCAPKLPRSTFVDNEAA